MNTIHIDGIITALSPIHHGGDESTGSRSTLRRIKSIVDGNRIDVPVISGNSIRGYLRRLVMSHMLESVGYGNDMMMSSLKTYHMLFSGGTLESVSSSDAGNINLEMRKKFRKSLPALSVFGSAVGNQMIEGKMKCGFALPICQELQGFLLQKYDISSYELLMDIFFTRRDDAHGEREEDEAAHQMIVNVEAFAPGTCFAHRFSLLDCNEIEAGVVGVALELWKERAYLGGKSGTGYGEISFEYQDAPSARPYTEYLKNNADDVIKCIGEIEEMLK
jgi:CRISPR/Cas system CSM-associated protein Csm3 (group 7 of RAMP superfamily)